MKTIYKLLLYIKVVTALYCTEIVGQVPTNNKDNVDSTEQLAQLHMLTYTQTLGTNYQSCAIQYREFEAEINDFVIPITLSFGNIQISDHYLEGKGIETIGSYSLGIGFDGYEYLGSGLYLNLGVGVQPGIELVTYDNKQRDNLFLINSTGKTGLLFVPFSEFGLALGTSIGGMISNSKGLRRSLGWSFEVGINF